MSKEKTTHTGPWPDPEEDILVRTRGGWRKTKVVSKSPEGFYVECGCGLLHFNNTAPGELWTWLSERDATRMVLAATVKERNHLREALEQIARASKNGASSQLARAALLKKFPHDVIEKP